jgi:hypothetical protein
MLLDWLNVPVTVLCAYTTSECVPGGTPDNQVLKPKGFGVRISRGGSQSVVRHSFFDLILSSLMPDHHCRPR